MRYLTLSEVLELHRQVVERTGGSEGLRDLGALESAVAQPRMTFGGNDLYPTIEDKATAPCLSLIQNHPFVDGNKRIGHAAMEVFLLLNGYELVASVDDAERVIFAVAARGCSRESLAGWIRGHIAERR